MPLRPARTQRPAVPPGRTSGATGRSLVSESLSNLARLQRCAAGPWTDLWPHMQASLMPDIAWPSLPLQADGGCCF